LLNAVVPKLGGTARKNYDNAPELELPADEILQ
jgi:hypothetical protein